MKLCEHIKKDHPKNIVDVDSWKEICPPKKKDKQWKEKRSAFELANYMTKNFPLVPKEIEDTLKAFVSCDTDFKWDAEYATPLPCTGEGRNHDAILLSDNNIVVTIEAKADEPLGNTIEKEIKNASVNKLQRIGKLLDYLFKADFNKYHELRYQLLTAAAGTLIEAERKKVPVAVMLVIVFETTGDVKPEKLEANRKDIDAFLKAVNSHEKNGLMLIPNNTDIELYFKKIVI